MDGGGRWQRQAVGDDLGNDGGGGGRGWMRMTDDCNDKWATACIFDGVGGVDIIDPNLLLAR